MDKHTVVRGKPFQCGDRRAGRPKGATNKASRELKEFWREFFDSPRYREALMARLLRGKAPHMERELHHYVFGKPREFVSVDGNLGVDVNEARTALADRIARLAVRLGHGGRAGD